MKNINVMENNGWSLKENLRLAQKIILSGFLGLFVLCAATSHAATNIVLATDSLQQKIDASASGDILVLEGGAYSGALSIAKPLSFVRSGTNTVQLLAGLTIQTTGSVAFVQMNFSSAIVVSGGVNLLLQDSILNSTLNVSGGKLTVKRCNASGRIDLASVDFEGLRVTNTGGIYATATVGTGKVLALAQSTISTISVIGYSKSWVAYCYFSSSSYTDCNATLVGNIVHIVNPGGGYSQAVYCLRGSMTAYNNKIRIDAMSWAATIVYVSGFRLVSCRGDIVNNTITGSVFSNSGDGGVVTRGILSSGGGGPIIIKANVVQIIYTSSIGYNINNCVEGGTEISELSFCIFGAGSVSGPIAYQCLYQDPALNSDSVPVFNSPCLNAGPPEAFFNDRVGTRNDIGFTGGPFYQANGMTTDKPLLFWLMPAQRQVWKNAQPTLNMEATATAGH